MSRERNEVLHKNMADENDQVLDDVIEDQPSNVQSEESEKEPTLKEVMKAVKGLQKGYTTTRQEMAELRELSSSQLQELASRMNTQSGANTGDDEYVTVGKLRQAIPEIMSGYETRKVQEAQERVSQAESILEEAMDEVIESDIIEEGEKQALWNYAASINETDLFKAAAKFNKLSQEKKDGLLAKKQSRQEVGSKVGTSSKSGSAGKVDLTKIHSMSWDDL